MTVFKGYIKNALREKNIIILYLLIFIVLGYLLVFASEEENKKEKLSITVIDNDKTVISKGLKEYFRENENLVEIKGTDKELREALYYENTSYVLFIEEGFTLDFKNGKAHLKGEGREKSNEEHYAKGIVKSYLLGIDSFLKAGYSDEEAVRELALIDKGLKTEDIDEKNNKISLILKFLPFVFIALSTYIYGFVLLKYKNDPIRWRHLASPVSEVERKIALFTSLITIGIGFLVIISIGTNALSNGEFFKSKNLKYYLINMAVMDFVGLSISIFVLSVSRTRNEINALANIFSLGMSFICGIFVPEAFLSPGINKVKKYLPAYWYGQNNMMLGGEINIDKLFKGYTYQILFALIILGVAIIISKIKDRKK